MNHSSPEELWWKMIQVDRSEFPVKSKLCSLLSSSRNCHILKRHCRICVILNQIQNLIFQFNKQSAGLFLVLKTSKGCSYQLSRPENSCSARSSWKHLENKVQLPLALAVRAHRGLHSCMLVEMYPQAEENRSSDPRLFEF